MLHIHPAQKCYLWWNIGYVLIVANEEKRQNKGEEEPCVRLGSLDRLHTRRGGNDDGGGDTRGHHHGHGRDDGRGHDRIHHRVGGRGLCYRWDSLRFHRNVNMLVD